jgi:bifunctional non-homologous end joining protein LigD
MREQRGRVDELAAYRAKRNFSVTAEPVGASGASGSGRFVVQRHRARRPHYDLRLEVGGVLASWAVPKGPTLDPKARHLAVRVEDHPIEYFDFEGVIPSGQYGGGDVIVWDWGAWRPADGVDPARAIKNGELHFDLRGEKLAGRFVLIRRDADKRGRDQWLLIHKNDDHARRGWDPEGLPRSVKTGRTNAEVAAAPEALWRSGVPAREAELRLTAPLRRWKPPTADELTALEEIDREGQWAVGERTVKVTNLDKVCSPAPTPNRRRPNAT